MENRDLELLEFSQIYEMVERLLLSAEGSEVLQEEPFFSQATELEQFRAPIIAMDHRLRSGFSLPRSRFPNISSAIHEVRREGATLEGEDIYAVGLYLITANNLIQWFSSSPDELMEGSDGEELLQSLVTGLHIPSTLVQTIESTLQESGEIRDDYPPLKALRRELATLYQSQQQTAQGYLQEDPSRFQTNQPTFRDNRVLLPVKVGFRSQISGVVQGMSASGSTVFMEPPGLMEMNNRVTEKQHELMRETYRVFQDLSKSIRENLTDIEKVRQWVGSVDTLMARAVLGHKWSGVPIKHSSQVGLKQCRHPLLGSTVVPVNIDLPPHIRGLVISGPNAGGKSVTMKTLGLFALMNQFGMLVPCAEGSVLPLFPKVFASIGDEQSIALALSTFSGQMRTISEICNRVEEGSLVILDEIGAGTDPLEGGALAQSVIEYFLQRDCLVVATSHHHRVKRFGELRDDIISGAMEFDEEHHTPTYRLMVGQIGESHGIETAHHYGIPQVVIDQAKSFLSQDDLTIDQQLRALERRREELARGEEQYAQREEELRQRIQQENLREDHINIREQELASQEARRTSQFLEESRKSFENLIREIREGELTKERIERGRAHIKQVEENLNVLRQKSQKTKQGSSHKQNSEESVFQPGLKVHVGASRQLGTLIEEDKRGRWKVQVGSMKFTFDQKDIIPIQQPKQDTVKKQVLWSSEQLSSPKGTLDLRGFRVEEALTELQQQLDRAISHKTGSFTILHGTGEGVLQKVVADFLSNSKYVKSFGYAPLEEGGYGKTVVHLQ